MTDTLAARCPPSLHPATLFRVGAQIRRGNRRPSAANGAEVAAQFGEAGICRGRRHGCSVGGEVEAVQIGFRQRLDQPVSLRHSRQPLPLELLQVKRFTQTQVVEMRLRVGNAATLLYIE